MFRKKILEIKIKKRPNPFENILQHFLKTYKSILHNSFIIAIFFSLTLSHLILHNKYMLMVN